MGEGKITLRYFKTGAEGRVKLSESMEPTSEKEIQIKALHSSDQYLITIIKETCSDGMSDNSYPYLIIINKNNETKLNGCGRIMENDFPEFWNEFKYRVSVNDKKGIMEYCTGSMKDFLEDNYENFLDKRMKIEISNTKPSEVETHDEDKKLFYYLKTYGNDSPGSTLGFWFEKIDGEWKITQPQIGG